MHVCLTGPRCRCEGMKPSNRAAARNQRDARLVRTHPTHGQDCSICTRSQGQPRQRLPRASSNLTLLPVYAPVGMGGKKRTQARRLVQAKDKPCTEAALTPSAVPHILRVTSRGTRDAVALSRATPCPHSIPVVAAVGLILTCSVWPRRLFGLAGRAFWHWLVALIVS